MEHVALGEDAHGAQALDDDDRPATPTHEELQRLVHGGVRRKARGGQRTEVEDSIVRN